MKVMDTEAIARFTRTYNPHQNPRQYPPLFKEPKTASNGLDSIRGEGKSSTTPVPSPEDLPEPQWSITLRESVILKLLNEKILSLSDILEGDED